MIGNLPCQKHPDLQSGFHRPWDCCTWACGSPGQGHSHLPTPFPTTLSSQEGLGFHTEQPRPINSSWTLTHQPSQAQKRK